MSRLGTPLLLVCSSISPDAIDDMARVAADLHELGELAQRVGVTVGFEALCWGRHINDYRQAWEAVRRADHAHVGLILDTFHALARKCPIEAIAEIPAERIVLVQTADAPGIEMDLLFLSRHYRCFPGQGDLPVVAMMRKLAEIGYHGPISHEIFSDDFRAGSARQIAIDGMRSFLWLDEQLGPRAGRGLPRDRRRRVHRVRRRPAPAAATPRDAAGLGFRRTHRHRSKDVELHRQGEINLVLNLEDEGFPHSFQLLHGLSVAALALRVDDAAARRRAADGDARPSRSPARSARASWRSRPCAASAAACSTSSTEPGRHGAFVEVDFVPDPETRPPPDLGLTRDRPRGPGRAADRVPELGPLLPRHPRPRARGAHRPQRPARADRQPGADQRRPHPAPRRSTPRRRSASAAGRFMRATAGAGAQHIAFACRDIFAAAAALPNRAAAAGPRQLLRGPRRPLRARRRARRAAARPASSTTASARGEFLHFFTRTINGLFFEVLERRGGYDRYGEANAPVRLAAQAALDRSAAEVITNSGADAVGPSTSFFRPSELGTRTTIGSNSSARAGRIFAPQRTIAICSPAGSARNHDAARGRTDGEADPRHTRQARPSNAGEGGRSWLSWSPAPWGMSATWWRAARPPRANA